MRISDWSSDVCSSDLAESGGIGDHFKGTLDIEIERRIGRRHGLRLLWQGRHQDQIVAPQQIVISGLQPTADILRLGLESATVMLEKIFAHQHRDFQAGGQFIGARSEEHTSELQSLMRISYAVFCLKKKTPHTQH